MDSEATFVQMTGITKSYWMGDAWSPVLRKLSASCGTCVRFTATFQSELADEDLEAV